MSLPVTNLKVGSVDLGEYGSLNVRELSRYELHKIREVGEDMNRAETLTLAFGASVDEEAAAEWLRTTGAEVADKVLGKILELSGMTEDAPKE